MASFLTDAAKQSLRGAIETVEGRSAAEVVVAVRARSGSYLHADFMMGALAAFGALAFMLFSSRSFGHLAILIEPLIIGLIVGFATSRAPHLRRILTLPAVRRNWVQSAAQSAFYARGISRTKDRTGVLVYASQLEKHIAVVADFGVAEAVDEAEWAAAVEALSKLMAEGGDGETLARAIEGLGKLLTRDLPRAPDDKNELPDEVAES